MLCSMQLEGADDKFTSVLGFGGFGIRVDSIAFRIYRIVCFEGTWLVGCWYGIDFFANFPEPETPERSPEHLGAYGLLCHAAAERVYHKQKLPEF